MMKLAVVFMLAVMPGFAADDAAETPDRIRLFQFLKMRMFETRGIPASAAASSEKADPSLPENDPAAIMRRFSENERKRTAAFDKQFGKGAFAGLVKLMRNCKSTAGCDKLSAAGLMEGAYLFTALEEDAQKTPPLQPSDYQARREKILAGMKPYLEQLQPNKTMSAGDAAERLKILGPINKVVRKIEARR